MKKNEKKKEYKVKKPSFWLYTLPAYLLRPYFKFKWNHKVDRKGIKGVKSPVLALANHCSTIDVVLTLQTLLPKKYNIVAGRDLFTWPALKPFIRKFGAIPKSQFSIDLAAMRTMKTATDDGLNVLIYPEGKTSLDGRQAYLAPAIAKFIKFMDCNVVMVHTVGAYLTRPRYTKGFRKGRVETKAYVLFTQEQVRSLSNKDLYEGVCKAMEYNDHVWQRENNIRFASEAPAANLNYLLYKCPKCGAEYENESDGKVITCLSCGNKAEYTEYGEIKTVGDSMVFERIDLWYDFQKEAVTEELKKGNFEISKEVTLLYEDVLDASFKEAGEGTLTIKDGEIFYIGTKDGEPFEMRQSLASMSTIVTKNSEGVDLTSKETIYRFLFKEHKWSVKYGLIVEQNFALNNGLV